jgi:inorganic pyrophosphatase
VDVEGSQNLWDLPVGPDPAVDGRIVLAYAIVETPCDSSNKYEYDPELGAFRLDRVLANSVHFPGDYGFIPSTIAEDGEPLDVLLVATGPSTPGTLVVVRPIGVADVIDGGQHDAKIIAVPRDEPRHAAVEDISHLGAHRLREIEHFFAIYKNLAEAAETTAHVQGVTGWLPAPDALRRIAQAHARYLELRQA